MTTKKKSIVENMNVSLQSPWVIYGKKIIRLFAKDPAISITTDYTDGRYTLYIDSDNKDKLTALSKILVNYVQMGNIEFVIEYNGIDVVNDAIATEDDWNTAFKGNYYFVNLFNGQFPFYTYAVFKREIITIFVDDLQDYCFNGHYIVADIVREVCNLNSNVSPCTIAV